MASSSTSAGPLPVALPNPCRNPGLLPAESDPPGSLARRQRLPQFSTPIQPGGCGPPPVGPPFPRPTSQMTGSSPGCHNRSSRPSYTTGATSTTPSASVGCLAAPGSPSSTAPGLTSTTTAGRTPAASSSWTLHPGHVGLLPPRRSVRLSEPSEPAVRYRAQRAKSCQTSRPPSPHSRRNSMPAVAVDTGVDASHEFLVDVESPRTGVFADASL